MKKKYRGLAEKLLERSIEAYGLSEGPPALSQQEQEVVNVLRTHDFGCHQTAVRKLASALVGRDLRPFLGQAGLRFEEYTVLALNEEGAEKTEAYSARAVLIIFCPDDDDDGKALLPPYHEDIEDIEEYDNRMGPWLEKQKSHYFYPTVDEIQRALVLHEDELEKRWPLFTKE